MAVTPIQLPLATPHDVRAMVPVVDPDMDTRIRDVVAFSLAEATKANISTFVNAMSRFWDISGQARWNIYLKNKPSPIVDPATGIVDGFEPSPLDAKGQPIAPQWHELFLEFPAECERMLKDYMTLAKRYAPNA